eukprot:CAMPEP_0204589604 /NCGR_PEP_ID=MMETSP0661-20131031/49295_1 /ASSEMBLY_ACC=CAM_ASM_000606 /TAXON_ID=109239 /ORGANISM="Alexandrium margalefi, Strain AMGDE01CS-322" /LENGTH=193 /DNA_ID=CAMNT_0051599533 /DNA_START=410 /DNA_END=987 /DNA_ORIENTATION=-
MVSGLHTGPCAGSKERSPQPLQPVIEPLEDQVVAGDGGRNREVVDVEADRIGPQGSLEGADQVLVALALRLARPVLLPLQDSIPARIFAVIIGAPRADLLNARLRPLPLAPALAAGRGAIGGAEGGVAGAAQGRRGGVWPLRLGPFLRDGVEERVLLHDDVHLRLGVRGLACGGERHGLLTQGAGTAREQNIA